MLQKPDLDKPVFTIFPEMKDKIMNGLCAICGVPLEGREDEFVDELSRSNYTVSGMCQQCQNAVFQEVEK